MFKALPHLQMREDVRPLHQNRSSPAWALEKGQIRLPCTCKVTRADLLRAYVLGPRYLVHVGGVLNPKTLPYAILDS